MSQLVIKRVSTRQEKKQFLELPWTLYRDDPNWIPPLRTNLKEMVGFLPNPFYERNRVQTFLAYRDGEVCGRIAAILNIGHIERHDERRGFFGFFECVDDQEAANGLFDAVREWFADQGIYCLRGPTNPSLNHELGLLIDGFDSPPVFMMTYNHEYYARLIESYGFAKSQDLYAYWGHVDMLPKIRDKLEPIATQIIERYDIRLRPLDKNHFLEDVEEFLSIYNRSMVNTWGFVPMSREEIQHTARGLRHLMVPELAIIAEIDGRSAGAVFGLPDYNPRIREIDGRLFPFGMIRLLRKKNEIKLVRMISTNVLPEFQRMGVGLVLMHGLVPKVLDWEIEEAEFSWVLESNMLSRGSLEKGGATLYKTYRLYDLDQEPPASDEPKLPAAAAAPTDASRQIVAVAKEPLHIEQVESRRDLDQFCKVPWKIYADDPHWVPPLLMEVKEFLNPRKHPFYQHGQAAQFLASRGGVPLGRILVSDDPRYNEQQGTNLGCFGMFESADDPEMAHALLDTAAHWLKARGREAMMGPIDYSMNYPCGLLIDGFETPPTVMMNHHRPYYAGLLQSWGLEKAKDLYGWWFVDTNDLVAKWKTKLERIARRSGVVVRSFSRSDFTAEIQRCKVVFNEGMQDNWGFVALTDAELEHIAKGLSKVAVAEHVLLAEIDGKPVGAAITVPDVNEAIRTLDGRLTNFGLPINLIRFKRRLRNAKTARMIALSVVEGYRRRGIAELLILQTLDYGKNTLGYEGAELGWTLEDNVLINRTIEAAGGRRYKTYRIYEKPI